MLYFAYGANTNIDNMSQRCPKAKLIGTIVLPDWKLVFKRVADIEPSLHSEVLGVIWDITDDCERSLDIFEGFPTLYRKGYFPVIANGEVEDVMFYKMNSNTYGAPSRSYFECIEDGYIQNDLDTIALYNSLDNTPIYSFQN